MGKLEAVGRVHEPKPGRLAFVCDHKAHDPATGGVAERTFVAPDDPVPECRLHGRMVLQANRPYREQRIPAAA